MLRVHLRAVRSRQPKSGQVHVGHVTHEGAEAPCGRHSRLAIPPTRRYRRADVPCRGTRAARPATGAYPNLVAKAGTRRAAKVRAATATPTGSRRTRPARAARNRRAVAPTASRRRQARVRVPRDGVHGGVVEGERRRKRKPKRGPEALLQLRARHRVKPGVHQRVAAADVRATQHLANNARHGRRHR